MKQYTQQQLKFINENFQQGQNAMQKGMFERAEKCFTNIVKIAPEIYEAQNALAFAYVASKQHDKAAVQFKIILKNHPNDAHTHHNFANSLYGQQHYEDAINHYQLALKINPKLVDSHTHCGMAYRMLKNYEDAITCFKQALNLDKANSKAFHVLGLTFSDILDYPRALECLNNAAGLTPNFLEYKLSFAYVLNKAGLSYEASAQYQDICDKNPNYIDGYIAYGKHLLNMRHYDEALECFTRASKLSPSTPDIIDEIGYSYLGLNNTEEAIKQFNAALAKAPNRLDSLVGIETAYQDAGKLDDAAQLCDQIIALDSTQPTGFILKSKILKSKPDDGLAESLLSFTDRTDLSDDTKVRINFALGKVFDDQKNHHLAFKHYNIANNLKDISLAYNKEASKASFTRIIETFNADFFKQHQNHGVASSTPIIIVGMPRSATTLTEQIISSHPDVIGAGEVTFWSDITDSMSLRLNSANPYPICIADLTTTQAHEISDMYLATLHKIAGPQASFSHITDKMPHNFLTLGLITTLFPNAKIIHTKRDPIDTCLSIYFQHFNDNHPYSFNLESLGFYYKQYERLMEHWHQVLPGRIMDIHYTDTISDPEYWTRKLISHLGLAWDDACLAPHKLERSVKTPSHWQVRQPIYKSSEQRWKNYEPYIQALIDALK